MHIRNVAPYARTHIHALEGKHVVSMVFCISYVPTHPSNVGMIMHMTNIVLDAGCKNSYC